MWSVSLPGCSCINVRTVALNDHERWLHWHNYPLLRLLRTRDDSYVSAIISPLSLFFTPVENATHGSHYIYLVWGVEAGRSFISPSELYIYTLAVLAGGPMSHASWWGSRPRGGTDSGYVVGSWLEGCRRRKSSLCYLLLIHSSRSGVSSSVSVSLCCILQIRQMTSHRPSSYQHWNNDTCTPAHLHTGTPASLLSPPNLGSLSAAVYLSGRDFSILQPETLTYESLGSPQKTNKSLCLSLHINPSPPVFSKCLFNENCCISSLSEYLMAPVSLQVPERGRDIWHRKAEPRTHI